MSNAALKWLAKAVRSRRVDHIMGLRAIRARPPVFSDIGRFDHRGCFRVLRVVALVALLALVGCQYELGNRVEIRTDDAYSSSVSDAWIARVRAGAAMWRLDGCLDPFPESGGAEPSVVVTLYTPANFPHGPGIIGFTPTDDVVDVKGPTPGDELGLLSDVVGHEFGHVLGIPHNADRTSIMYENSDGASVPNARDIAAARDRLGC